MTDAERQTFKLLDPAGNVIAHGDIAAVTEPILSPHVRTARHFENWPRRFS
jgi:hypothetical protein